MINYEIIPSLITGVCFIIIIGYIVLENKRFNGSDRFLTNVIIEKNYKEWFKENSTLLRKRKLNIHDLNRLVYQLKEKLVNEGIRQDTVKKYVSYLRNSNSKEKSLFKKIISGIAAITTGFNSLIGFYNNLFKPEQSEGKIYRQIIVIPNLTNNNAVIELLIFISLFAMYIIGIVVIMYQLVNIENRQLNKLRLGLLEHVCEIWCYNVDSISENDYGSLGNKENTIYLNVKSEKDRFDKIVDMMISSQVKVNMNFIYKIPSMIKDCIVRVLRKLFEFLLGFIVPIGLAIFEAGVVILIFWILNNDVIIVLKAILIFVLAILVFIGESMYLSILNAHFVDSRKEIQDKKDGQEEQETSKKNIRIDKYNKTNCKQLLTYLLLYVVLYLILLERFYNFLFPCEEYKIYAYAVIFLLIIAPLALTKFAINE